MLRYCVCPFVSTLLQGVADLLFKRTRNGGLAYLADWDGQGTRDKMDHLVCFVPGMLGERGVF